MIGLQWEVRAMLKETLNAQTLIDLLVELPVLSISTKSVDAKEVLERLEVEGNGKELQFLKDLFTLQTEEVVEKWYNKEELMEKVPEELR